MKTIKPLRVGVMTRAFENDGACHFAVAPLVFFALDESARLLTEIDLWKTVPKELGADGMLDAGMPKARGEVLVAGKACAVGAPRAAVNVRVQVGPVDKHLIVIGNRYWLAGAMTEPEPFTEMPITWANAFGGEKLATNPVGKGLAPVKTERGELHPLPNVEHPHHRVQSPKDRPTPVGLAPLDQMWPQRAAKVGTYDDKWLRERFPGLPRDIDWTFFNTAPEDQWIPRWFRGDEAYLVEGMNPEHVRLEGRLPAVQTRVFVTLKKHEAPDEFREVETRLETVWLFPNIRRGVLIFRGVTPIAEDDGADVLNLLLAAEHLGEPRTVDYYRETLAQRLDKKNGPLLALRDADLMPPPRPGEPPRPAIDLDIAPEDGLPESQDLLKKNMRRRADREIEQARQKITDLGMDPDKMGIPKKLAPEDPPPALDQLPAEVEKIEKLVEEMKAEAAKKQAEAEKQVREVLKQGGLDYDEVMRKGQEDAGGPPKFRARTEIARLEGLANDIRAAGAPVPEPVLQMLTPEFLAKMLAMEQQVRDAYRMGAHHFPPVKRPPLDEASRLRNRVLAAVAAGEGLADEDLSGADLRDADLAGANLAGAFLERANLTGANLTGANLERAVLARADLTAANLAGAKLAGANLGLAVLRTAHGDGADFTATTLYKADLGGASFHGATLVKTDLAEAVLANADFTGATAVELMVMMTDVSGVRFTNANLTKCLFIDVTMNGVDFAGATFTSGALVQARGRDVNFRGAKLDNFRVVHESALPGANFVDCDMNGANLRGTVLDGADLSRAKFDAGDLSDCSLKGARLYQIVAREARLVRADLTDAVLISANFMMAVLQKARISGADFRGANLFRADMARVKGGARHLDEALLTQVRVLPRSPDGPR